MAAIALEELKSAFENEGWRVENCKGQWWSVSKQGPDVPALADFLLVSDNGPEGVLYGIEDIIGDNEIEIQNLKAEIEFLEELKEIYLNLERKQKAIAQIALSGQMKGKEKIMSNALTELCFARDEENMPSADDVVTFYVPTEWLKNELAEHWDGWDFEEFMSEYTSEEAKEIYSQAILDGLISDKKWAEDTLNVDCLGIFSIDLCALFDELNTDGKSVVRTAKGFKLERTIEDGEDYYTLYDDAKGYCIRDFCINDGETCAVLEIDGNSIVCQEAEENFFSKFTLTRDEFKIAAPDYKLSQRKE